MITMILIAAASFVVSTMCFTIGLISYMMSIKNKQKNFNSFEVAEDFFISFIPVLNIIFLIIDTKCFYESVKEYFEGNKLDKFLTEKIQGVESDNA